MKAVVCGRYGPPGVLRLKELPVPVPRDGEVLIKTHAASVTMGDCEVRASRFPWFLWLPIRLAFGVLRPRRAVMGQELAGEIVRLGKGVAGLKTGDQVFGTTGFSMGAYAQYTCLPVKGMAVAIAPKPAAMTYEEAACVPVGGLNALHFIRKAELSQGRTILINGAGGGIGTIAVQFARHLGAEVTAVDKGSKLSMLRELGADHVIDCEREDYTRAGRTWDVIFDVAGKSPFGRSMRCLNKGGRFLLGNPRASQLLQSFFVSKKSGKRVMFAFADHKAEDLLFLKGLIEAGVLKSVIDRRFPLEETAAAHAYVETGQKKGCVVITVRHEG